MFRDRDSGVTTATWDEVLQYDIDPGGERAELGRRYLEAEAARSARAEEVEEKLLKSDKSSEKN